jgi:predicted nucleic acid-binding protein
MTVVSDTSPITNLAAIGQIDLLRSLFGTIHIPRAVWDELSAQGQEWPGFVEVKRAEWFHQHEVTGRGLVLALEQDLDTGEAEALALARELNATLVLIDEREGRRAAKRLGLRAVGVVGVLIEAKERALLSSVRPHLEALRSEAGFYLSDGVYQYALSLVDE